MPDQEALASMRAAADAEFPDRNLDHLRQRVASMPTTGAHRTSDAMEVLADRLIKAGGGTLTLVLDEAGDWSAVFALDGGGPKDKLGYGATHAEALAEVVSALRPHVAAQEDDGDTD